MNTYIIILRVEAENRATVWDMADELEETGFTHGRVLAADTVFRAERFRSEGKEVERP